MAQYRPYSRREFAERLRVWARSHWRTLVALTCGAVILLGLETLLIVGLGEPTAWHWYVLGLLHAGVVGALVAAIYLAYLAHDREAIFHLRGAWGEENTRDELGRAKRRRLIWGWVDSLTLQRGDIDHIVLTRNGGILAIDSKWRSSIDLADRDSMVAAAQRARMRAEGVMRSLVQRESGDHRARVNSVPVRAVVVVWGAGQSEMPNEAEFDGVTFVRGRRLVAWLGQLDGVPVDKSVATELLRKVEQMRATAAQSV